MRRAILGLFMAVALCMTAAGTAAASALYYTSGGRVYGADLDGGNATLIGGNFAAALHLDARGPKLYFTGDLPLGAPIPSGRIWRMDVDGSNFETLRQLDTAPGGVAVLRLGGNFGADKIYWTDGEGLHRADLDGGRPELLVQRLGMASLAIDRAHAKIYWTEPGGDSTPNVLRSNLDGSGVQEVVSGYQGPSTGIAIDPEGGKIYWGYLNPNIDSLYASSIMASDIDGTSTTPIISGLGRATGIALDMADGHLYWSDAGISFDDGSIGRANLDGSDPQILIRQLTAPGGIALDPAIPEPHALALATAGAVGLLLRRRKKSAGPGMR